MPDNSVVEITKQSHFCLFHFSRSRNYILRKYKIPSFLLHSNRMHEIMAQDEPIFDLIAQLLGTSGKQKQIFRQGNKNVRSHLGLGVLSLQFATIANQIWSMPFRTISHIKGAFARFMHILQLYGVLDDFRRKTVIFE